MKKSFLVLFVLLFSLPAYGMVYKWTDSAGVAHFTNKAYEVPARYRAKAKSLYPELGDTEASQQNVQAQQLTVVTAASSVQLSKPEEQAKTTQPVIVPEPSKSPSGWPASKVRHRKRGPVE